MSTKTILMLLSGALFIGLLLYAYLKSRTGGGRAGNPSPQTRSSMRGGTANNKPVDTIDDVDIIGIRGGAFLTSENELFVLVEINPFQATTGLSYQAVGHMFQDAIQKMDNGTWLQFFQMPTPISIESHTDIYAYNFRRRAELEGQARQSGDILEATVHDKRSGLPISLGAMLLDFSQETDLTLRRSFIVVSHTLKGVDASTPPEDPAWEDPVRKLWTKAAGIIDKFEKSGFALTPLDEEGALEVLWHSFNAGAFASSYVYEDRVRRFSQIIDYGQADNPSAATVTTTELRRAVNASPDDQLAIKHLLAPPAFTILPDRIVFSSGRAATLYQVDDFAFDTLPGLNVLLKGFPELTISYYLTNPQPASVIKESSNAIVTSGGVEKIRTEKGFLTDHRRMRIIDESERARAAAQTGEGTPRHLGMYLMLVARSSEDLDLRKEAFEAHLNNLGIRTIPPLKMQYSIWRTLLPLGQRYQKGEDRNIDAVNSANLTPTAGIPLFDPDGYYHGVLRSSDSSLAPTMPVIIDRVGKGDNPGSSDIKIGEQGAGKSVAQKTEIASWLALEDLVIVIDAKNEYGALAEEFGGEIVTIGGQGEEGMNILHFSEPATQQLADVMFDDNVTTIASRYASLKDSLNPSLTGPEMAMITRGLRRAMELKGMDSKDPSTWVPNKVFLGDVYEAIGELKETDHVSASLIMSTLYEYADPEGQYYKKYNTPSNTKFTHDFVVIQFGRPGVTANEYDRAADYHFAFRQAMNYAIERFVQDELSRPIRIVVDEASQFMVDKYLVGSVIRAVSIGRAFSITVHLAFQSAAALRAADSLSGAAGGTTQSINSLTGIGFTYQLFKNSPESAMLIGQMLGLTQEETMSIPKQGVGEMLLVLPDQHRIPIRWVVPDNWLSLFRTDTATMKQYYRKAFADTAQRVGQEAG